MKTSAPPVKTSLISTSLSGVYLNLLERLFLDWKEAAWPEVGADTIALGFKPAGAHGWKDTGVWAIRM
mgnify:CR=1 FL=1